MNWLLRNLRWKRDQSDFYGDIRIANGKITAIGHQLLPTKKEAVLDLAEHFVYPGLINSHDHLEFNLYPNLGHPPYSNYVEWSKDIHHPDESPIKEIQLVPLNDRLLWGALKNLISGVTLVVHHNPYYRYFNNSFSFRKSFPLRVFKNYQWRHSLKLDEQEKPLKRDPTKLFIIHAAEGIDPDSTKEIGELAKKGWLGKNTLMIHGVGVKPDQVNYLSSSNTSLVWCPTSNLYLFGQTAPIPLLKNLIRISLGTDSTLTGPATLFEEMRAAKATGWADEKQIFEMVTKQPINILRFHSYLEPLSVNAAADILILPAKHASYHRNLIEASPQDIQLLLINGRTAVADGSLETLFRNKKPNVLIGGRSKSICVDVQKLQSRISKTVPSFFLKQNPLWTIIESLN